MIIAINTIQIQSNAINFDIDFLVELMLHKALQEPDNQFVFIVNTPVEASVLPTNCTTQLVQKQPASTSSLLLFSFITLPALLKKIKADMVFQLAGYGCIIGHVQQVVFVSTALSTKALVVKKSLQKATNIVVGSEILQNELSAKFQTPNPKPQTPNPKPQTPNPKPQTPNPKLQTPNSKPQTSNPKLQTPNPKPQTPNFKPQTPNPKLQIIPGAAHAIFKPLNYIETNVVKDGYADGREYFLAVASAFTFIEFINLLKAFSDFKKWQKSSMKLLVLGHIADYKNQLSDKIATYKYRDDVELLDTEPLDVEAKLFGAAYAVLSLANQSQYHLPILQAFQANVPIICIDNNSFSQAINNAVLTIPKNDVEAIANKLKLLYRDENLRSQKIAAGQALSQLFTYNNAYQQLQQGIAPTVL
ncbi:MAG: glycosyltransferase [Flavobacterium sp.]|nr:glycosyltransferase [Flavobacterium sp.]